VSEVKPLVALVGPTAVGKSAAGLRLARAFDGEIINADSQQVYRGFDIGTDKPGPDIRAAVPHHLVDVADPRDQFTAADFVAGALAAAGEIHGRGRLPLVVGGSGLYFKALLDGLFPGPGRDPELRRRLEDEARDQGLEALYRRLLDIDPDYAGRVRSRDRIRIIRALEVYQTTGRTMTDHFRETVSPVRHLAVIKVGLDLERAVLYRRIEERVERMFARGLVAEVRGLLAAGVPESAPPFKGLGYRQVLEHLRGELSLDGTKAAARLETRHYAKRQLTWFRKMAGVTWFPAGDSAALESHLAKALK
jgi:tRNA dimethylallyltransferase